MSKDTCIIQNVIQDLDAIGERIGQSIDAVVSETDVKLLEEALVSLSETRVRLQGRYPVTLVKAAVVPLR